MERYELETNNSITNLLTMEITTKQAVDKLTAELVKDPELYYAYQSNIAMPFVDTASVLVPMVAVKDLHEAANEAAKTFLDLLCHYWPTELQKSIIELEAERLEWSLKTFPEATPISSLRKVESEIAEIEKDINDGVKNPMEYADALMCLFDSAGRNDITVQQIFSAFAEKLEVNKKRVWRKNPDNSYSHIK